VSLELNSNVTDERQWQKRKHSLPKTSTDDGIQIDFNPPQQQNAKFSIRVSFELDSNVNDEMEEHE
jgi:hypothetical protein